MKKILLILIVLLLTGCYDYVEINNLSFISCIGIDYDEDKFKLTYEILNDTKKGAEQASQEGYTISGSGSSIAKAFDNISLKIAKLPYFYHLKSIVISEPVAKEHMQEIVEYVTRNPEIRNEFYLVIAKDIKASEIVKNANTNNPIVGNQITKLIESNVKDYNVTFSKPFEDILEKFQNPKIDPIVSVMTLTNDDLTAEGIAIFDGYKYIDTLSPLNSAYLNVLLNENANLTVSKKYNNKTLAVNLYDGKADYEFKDKQIIIKIALEGEVTENLPEFDLRDDKTYQDLSKDFSKVVKTDIEDLIKIIVSKNVDAIGLENMYYKENRKTLDNILQVFDIKVEANVKINKRGLIYEVESWKTKTLV